MARIKLILQDVTCYDTEDVTGADEFYLVGAISDGIETSPVLTKPISVNDNQTKSFGDGGATVFDKEVPNDRVLKIALVAFDEDAGKDWSKHGEMVTKIGNTVSQGISSIPRPEAAAAGMILPFVIAGVGTLMQLDQDDELGKYTYDIPVSSLPNGNHLQVWSFQGGGGWWSSWKYAVRYRIIRE